MEKEVDHIRDLIPDPQNARKHNSRNIGMVAESLQEVGAARSIVIDENNVVLAGNGVVEAAAQVGITTVRVVEASGNEIVAVRRSNLNETAKKRLALFDNRAAELAEWDTDVLGELKADDAKILEGLWSNEELERVLNPPAEFSPAPQAAQSKSPVTCPNCGQSFIP